MQFGWENRANLIFQARPNKGVLMFKKIFALFSSVVFLSANVASAGFVPLKCAGKIQKITFTAESFDQAQEKMPLICALPDIQRGAPLTEVAREILRADEKDQVMMTVDCCLPSLE